MAKLPPGAAFAPKCVADHRSHISPALVAGRQEDAHEFLTKLLERVERDAQANDGIGYQGMVRQCCCVVVAVL